MEVNYIVIQAGGKGTRMEHLTRNRPKALVPIDNLPMIFYNFRKFRDKKFIIIGDYKCDVLKRYLEVFAEVQYIVLDAKGTKGTCGGLQMALDILPENEAFLLIWSDLILPEEFCFPHDKNNYIGISEDFECRWSYSDNEFKEVKSKEKGVAGFFIFKEKGELKDVPLEGEFVRWLQKENKVFEKIGLRKTKEFGLISEYRKLKENRCRPFNRLIIEDGKIIKEGIDEQGKALAVREKAWYKYVTNKGFLKIPKIYSYEPFIMQKINGQNVFEYKLDLDTKKQVLEKIVKMLNELHSLQNKEVDYFSVWDTYFSKTFSRLNKIQNMIPFALDRYITINGKKCRNVFFYKKCIEEFVANYKLEEFSLIHGDCTFSNMLLNEKLNPILIDPRGYFGSTLILGDKNYDWAKVYYSIVGDYDQFNLKRFDLKISENDIILQIESNNWKDMEEYFFELLGNTVSKNDIKMLHAIIWLSLTTYAWEDYDSICGAFYNGLLYFEEAMYELFPE